jgi:hypothetical protein
LPINLYQIKLDLSVILSPFICFWHGLGPILVHVEALSNLLRRTKNFNNEMGSLITKSLAHLLDHPHDGASLN